MIAPVFKKLLVLLLLLPAIVCRGQKADVLKYIKENAVPLDTTLASNDLTDLGFLRETLAGKRLVAMGEATHGTHEFQVAKIRVFKYLVTQLGFKLFAIEANFTRCREINNYILYGRGSAKSAVAGMVFWEWNTTEVLTLVEWMRSYNRDKLSYQKIKFYGFDPQYDTYTLPAVKAAFHKLDSAYFEKNFAVLSHLNLISDVLSNAQRDTLKETFVRLRAYFIKRQNDFLKILPPDDLVGLGHDIRILEQCLDLNQLYGKKIPFSRAIAMRDEAMSENVQWILTYEGKESKMMLWAHNFHISKKATKYGSMGENLKEIYKDAYYALGFEFNKGDFRAGDWAARKIVTFTLGDAAPGSAGNVLSTAGLQAMFIDVNKGAGENSPAKSFFNSNVAQHGVGDSYSADLQYSLYQKGKLSDMYDGLIFINQTKGTVPISK